MRHFGSALAGAALLLSMAGTAAAKNELVILTQDAFMNDATIEVEGDFNGLQILQEHTGGGANLLEISITGNRNGGPEGAAFSGAALLAGLEAGAIVQRGFANTMSVDVFGSDNLFAFSQAGSGNTLKASISGMANQAVVSQTGTNNFASFSQAGIGNTVSIMQTSW